MLNLNFWNLLFTIINMIVLYLLLKKFFIGPVTAIMEKREAIINSQLECAKSTEADALELKRKWDEEMSNVQAKSSTIVEEAKDNAKQEYDKIVGQAEEQADKIIKDAQKTMELEREKTLREVQTEIANLAMTAAAKILIDGSNEKINESIYDQFLIKAGDFSDTNNG